MSLFKSLVPVVLLAVTVGLAPSPPVAASDGFCDFSLAGTVDRVVCLLGPEPPQKPCFLRVLVEMDGEIMQLDVWCHDQMADVCASLERGLPVIVLGEDHGDLKLVSHIAVWLEAEPADFDEAEN